MPKLIIAEDERLIAALIKKILSDNLEDIEIVAEARNGRSALDKIREYSPDLVLMDINMPVMSGLEVISQCREEHIEPSFVIISGYSDFAYVQQALRLGVEDYLLKPIQDDKLCQVVRTALTKRQITAMDADRNARNADLAASMLLGRILLRQPLTIEEANDAYGTHFAETLYRVVAIRAAASEAAAYTQAEADLTVMAQRFKRDIAPLCDESFSCQQGALLIVIVNYTAGKGTRIERALQNWLSTIADERSHGSHFETRASRQIEGFPAMSEACRRLLVSEQEAIRLQPADLNKLTHALHDEGEGELLKWFTDRYDAWQQRNNVTERETLVMVDIAQSLMARIYQTARNMGVQVDESAGMARLIRQTHICELRQAANELLLSLKREVDTVLAQEDNTIRKVTDYIDTHLADQLSLEEVARAVYLTPGYLSEYFRDKVGQNYRDYVFDKRMSRARELLENGTDRIQDISLKCGYADWKHFCKLFRKAIGVTPSEYRRIHGRGLGG